MKRINPVPVYLLSGFLGSGKTTLLTKAIDYVTESGRKPAVIMNEIGEVNLDGLLIDTAVPMAELLSGCICCSIRGDLATTIKELLTDSEPDAIFIESTGVANPIEIVDEITDASLVIPVELKSVITVVDAPQLLQLSRTSAGKTFLLMQEQIRCASLLILNKSDLVSAAELKEVEQLIRGWNPQASLEVSVYSQVDMGFIEDLGGKVELTSRDHNRVHEEHHYEHEHEHVHDHDHDHAHDHHDHDHGHGHENQHNHHHSHDHVIAYTHYFDKPIDSNQFEQFLSKLPYEVYRAKGILTFSDTGSRFMFQYAYREVDFVKITPQGDVRDVAVFIGENFSREAVRAKLEEL